MSYIIVSSVLGACSVQLLECAPSSKAPIARVREISCKKELYPCMVQADNSCLKGFTLVVTKGTKSAPSIENWKAAPDGMFHLLVTCNEEEY